MSDRNHLVDLGLAALAVSAAITVGVDTRLPTAVAAPSAPTSDEFGYLNSAARCDDTQTLMAYGRTARALVVICVNRDGALEYRGMRVSDQAGLEMPAARAPDGAIVATNNGVTYAVSPTMLLVSEGDTVLYRDSWTEFRQPRFSEQSSTSGSTPTSATPTSSAAASSTSASSAGASTSSNPTTVSTTTVTMTPTTSKPGT